MAIDNRTKLARSTSDEIDIIEEKLMQNLSEVETYWTAIDELSRLVTVDPFNHLIYRNRGHHYLTLSKFDLARADLTLSLKMFDYHWKTWHYLGLLNIYAGDYEEAIKCYDMALDRVLPDMPTVACCMYWQYIALLHAGKKDSEKAKAILAGVDKENQVFHQGYKNQMLMFKGEYTPEQVQEFIAGKPAQYVSAYGYGIAMYHYFLEGNKELARKELKELLETSPGWYAVAHMASAADIERL